jgi:hypothetical protein
MPFDGKDFEIDKAGAEAFKRFDREPTLRGLAYALRHPDLWPPSFREWDYSHAATCAIGLTNALLRAQEPWFWLSSAPRNNLFQVYGIDAMTVGRIFFNVGKRRHIGLFAVTPEHVAETIDRVLAEREGLLGA